MALNPSGMSPLNSALSKLGALPPQPAQSPKDQFDAIARETNVPANVLMALDGGRGDADGARRNAQALAGALGKGAKLDDAVSSLIGDPAAAAAVLEQSYRIADELYPVPEGQQRAPRGPGLMTDVADTAKAFGSGAVRAAGGAVQMGGVMLDDTFREAARQEAAASGQDPIAIQGESIIRSGSRAANDAIGGLGERMVGSMSERGQQAMRDTTPEGELLRPSTWSLGADPSIRGAVLQAAQGMGSMAPLVATPSPATAAAFGSLMAGGEGADAGRQFVLEAARTEGEDGRPIIESIPGYQDLIAEGMSPEAAAQELARKAESEAGFRQSLIGAVGGAATNRIMRSADGWLGAGGRMSRAAKKGAAGFIEEGTQEALEGAAAQSGIGSATGEDVNLAEDSFANFALGGLAGGGMGVTMGGLGPGGESTPGADDVSGDTGEDAAPLQLTGPDGPGADGTGNLPAAAAIDGEILPPQQELGRAPAGLLEPAFIDGQASDQGAGVPGAMGLPSPEHTAPDGSGGGVAVPGVDDTSLSDAPGAAPLPAQAGPMELAAQTIIEDTPPAAPEAPPNFPEYKPGSAVRLGNAEADSIHDGVFMGETSEGNARIRVNGQQMDLTPQEFDTARDNVARIEAAQKEGPRNVESERAGETTDGGMPGGVRVADERPEGSEGTAARGSVEPQGTEGVPSVDEGGLPGGKGRQQTGPGDLGGVVLADDAGEPAGPLNEALTEQAPDQRQGQQMQDGEVLTTPETGQVSTTATTPASWSWRGKKINTRNRARAITDYFTPGNIVESYGGGRDRVISFDPKAGQIQVEQVEQRDGEWVAIGETRSHSTLPEDRALVRGPVAQAADPITAAAAQADPEPTEAQKESGNYRKGHARWNGLDLSIENAKGSERSGRGPDGTEWSVTMPAHYGYFRRTEGADGDHVDFYMGENPDASHAWIIDQVDAETGAYDEAKVMLGFDSAAEARAAHEAAFSDGKGAARLGGIRKMTVPKLKEWLANGKTKEPVTRLPRRETRAPAPQRRPFINYVGSRFRGINPTGKAAEELRHRGVTARTAPGLFRRTGLKELDNLVASEHPDLIGAIAVDPATGYFDPAAIIEAIAEEVGGRAQPIGDQAVVQQQARDAEQAERDRRSPPQPVQTTAEPGSMPAPDLDIRTSEERRGDIARAVDDEVGRLGLDDVLTDPERSAIVDEVDRTSTDIWDTIYDFIVRSDANANRESAGDGSATSEGTGVPFFDDERAGGSESDAGETGRPGAPGEGPAGPGRSEGNDPRPGADPSLTDAPAAEAGADGLPQTILPGMEGSQDQARAALTAQKRAEIEARQRQSRVGRLDGNTGDAGPLFNEQAELLQRDMSERPVVAELTGEELGEWSDMRDLGRKATEWYRENLFGRSVTMETTGWTINFGRIGARKIGGRKGDVLLRLIPALDQIIEKSRLVSSTQGNKPGTERQTFHKVSARVKMAGSTHDIIATLREDANGTFHYDLSMDQGAEANSPGAADRVAEARSGPPDSLGQDSIGPGRLDGNDQAGDNVGARHLRNGDPAMKAGRGSSDSAIGSRPYGFEDNPVTLNLDFADAEINSVPATALRGIASSLRQILAQHGLARSISPKLVRTILSASGARVLGSYRNGEIKVSETAPNPAHVIRHEIIHALRDPQLWGKDYGLFSQAEWQALARAARRNQRIRAAVEAAYPDLPTSGQTEEMVAELYADWATDRESAPQGMLAQALDRIMSFFRSMASALRGEGFQDAASIMERIADGEIGTRAATDTGDSRGPDTAMEQRDLAALKEALSRSRGKALGMIGRDGWTGAKDLLSNLLTDAMGRNARFNVLSLVPGRALFTELAKNLPAAQQYLGLKERMDADRNKWQARAAEVVDTWTAAARKSPTANMNLMDLMHDCTLAGIDPSKIGSWKRDADGRARQILRGKPSPAQVEMARITLAEASEREAEWNRLREKYDALPKTFQDLYAQIRDEYSAMADEMDAALMDNIRASARMVVRKADREYRKEMNRIKDEGLTGKARDEAVDKATNKRTKAHARAAAAQGSRLQQMRQLFESNRLSGPYFPLARFGNYFVTIRDDSGKVVSFSRFEKAAQQQAFIDQAQKDGLGKVESGVLGGDVNLREKVDPRFLADVEELLAESGASKELMDSVWQRWLETLPDQSVRTNKIHRKGRSGFNKDAIRAFSSAMFHGAHQQARLRFGAEMEDALEVAEEQAKSEPDPNRAGFVVREMKQRHAFTMQPTNNPMVTMATSAAFVWYLGMSPAAAAVNVSQTTVVGIPIMATRYRKAGVNGTIKALSKASMDFMRGKGKVSKRLGNMPVWTDQWSVENAPNLTDDERRAMQAGYERGVIDKTQANDLASVADSGVEYSGTRERVMRVIGFMFHHAERFNREVTYLASYRLAREEGLSHDAAISSAASMSWKVHFDYQNTSKPRAMTGDAAKILTVFRNFQVNMLFRLFRDTHQAFNGADAETRREARNQLVGVTLSMMSHAGIRGVWGYALLTGLLSLFFPGADDGDDIDAWLQDALLMEGDGLGVAAWNWTMGLALNGAPGHALGINLTNRIGMPDLWFQSSQRDLEGQDLWHFYLEQIAGPAVGIAGSVVQGAATLGDGHVMRGLEKMVPTFARNTIKTTRYASEGVNTFYGDPLIENVSPWQLLVQLQGFTPSEITERYQINNRLRNKQARIENRRKDIIREIGDAVRKGEEIPEAAVEKMRRFNQEIPEWAISADTIRQSVRSRTRASQRNEFGVALNPRLNERLRSQQPPALYN